MSIDYEKKLDGLYEAYDHFLIMQDFDSCREITNQIKKIKELMERENNE